MLPQHWQIVIVFYHANRDFLFFIYQIILYCISDIFSIMLWVSWSCLNLTEIFFLKKSWIVSSSALMCPFYVSLSIYAAWALLNFLDLWVDILYQFWKNFQPLPPQIFLISILFSLLLEFQLQFHQTYY